MDRKPPLTFSELHLFITTLVQESLSHRRLSNYCQAGLYLGPQRLSRLWETPIHQDRLALFFSTVKDDTLSQGD